MFSVPDLEQKLGVKSYVIKFWENNFPLIHPTINDEKKYYSQRDLEIFFKIKKYLYDEELSVEETQNKLNELFNIEESRDDSVHSTAAEDQPPLEIPERQFLQAIVEDIEEILKNLRSGPE